MTSQRLNNVVYDLSIEMKNGDMVNILTESVDVDEIKSNLCNIMKKDLIQICIEFDITYRKSWSNKKLENTITSFLDELEIGDECIEIYQPIEPSKYKLAELFAGTGGFSFAFKNTNKVNIVFANDYEKSCKIFYDANFITPMSLHDIDTYDITNLPDFDILTGGFPCQPYSIAGQRKGFADPRGNVFWKIIDIIKLKKPKCFIMENVKNLLSHDSGNSFELMLNTFKDNHYYVKYAVLNTCKHTTIPQNRERVYIVGFLKQSQSADFTFPQLLDSNDMDNISKYLTTDAIPNKFYYNDTMKVWPLVHKSVVKNIDTNTVYQYRRTIVRENMNNVCPTLTANMGGGGHNVPLIKDSMGIRKLTPKECFNLQGFPADVIFPSLSNSALYKMAGNAITVELVKLLANEVIRVLDAKVESESEAKVESDADAESEAKVDAELSKYELSCLFNTFKMYCAKRVSIYLHKNKKARMPNFPEDISENIVRQYILQKEHCDCIWTTQNGDLYKNTLKLRIEVKCFSSTGPTSFGPTETWDELYFLDATGYLDDLIKIYRIDIKSSDARFQNIKINKKETYGQQCDQKRRPRVSFSIIQNVLKNDNDFQLAYDGTISDLIG